MFKSLKIGRWLGVDVFVHPSFWLLPLFVVLSTGFDGGIGAVAFNLASIFALFGCVALHEYGHVIAARGYGIRTRDITLYPIGGVASLEGMPRRPGPEIVVALAGPAVNVAIAVLIGLFTLALGATVSNGLSVAPTLDAFLSRLLWANVFLVAFNLLPAFPMDGGRVFRAVLSYFMDRVSATTVAVTVGSVLAGLMALLGLWQMELFLVILAFSVFMMGRAELNMVRYQAQYDGAVRRAEDRFPIVEPIRTRLHTDGWVFDPQTGLWTEWQDGVAVRRMR